MNNVLLPKTIPASEDPVEVLYVPLDTVDVYEGPRSNLNPPYRVYAVYRLMNGVDGGKFYGYHGIDVVYVHHDLLKAAMATLDQVDRIMSRTPIDDPEAEYTHKAVKAVLRWYP